MSVLGLSFYINHFDISNIPYCICRNPTPFSTAHYGERVGPVWMDELKCSGKESDLESCSFNGWGIEDCSHSEDAGVKCGNYICN